MKSLDFGRYVGISVAAAMLVACGGSQPPIGAPGAMPQSAVPTTARTNLQDFRHDKPAGPQSPIQHVIVIVQESRSFDNLFAGYPGADAPTTGLTSSGKRVPLRTISLTRHKACILGWLGEYFQTAYDNGKMDGWNLLDARHPLCPYTRVERSETQPYWNLAKRFALADQMFASTRFGEFVEQLYLIAGTTKIYPRAFVVGIPSSAPWGCDAPPGTTTSLLKNDRIEQWLGPFPCFTQVPTMANLLDNANVSWKFYWGGRNSILFNPFDAISYVRTGPDWGRNMSAPATNIFSDLSQGHLAALSWVLSPFADSDIPGSGRGPAWVNSIVRGAQQSRYWKHSAIVVIWSDAGEGNFYDNVAPPQLDVMGLGFRVPMIVMSPYAKRAYVSHTEYEFGSVLKYIEENWKLGSLGATDRRANSIGDMFDYSL